MKFEFQGTVNLHLHGTVCVIIKFLYPNSLIIAYFCPFMKTSSLEQHKSSLLSQNPGKTSLK